MVWLLAVTLRSPYATLTPLSFDDVPGPVRAATEDRETDNLTHVPDSDQGMRDAIERRLVESENRGGVPCATPGPDDWADRRRRGRT